MTEIEQIQLDIKSLEEFIKTLPSMYTGLTQFKQWTVLLQKQVSDFIIRFQAELDNLNPVSTPLDSSLFVSKIEWKQLDNIRQADINGLELSIEENSTLINNQIYALSLQVDDLASLINDIDLMQLQNVSNHINNILNPHNVTKSQVGLGMVENFSIASEDEARQGDVDTAYMTPSKVNLAIHSLINNTTIDGGEF